MKFFHLSDLHIGLRLMNRDLREDHEHVLKQIVDYAREERPDAIVIAGDIYDKSAPSGEAVEVFDHFITELKKAAPGAVIMAISGNHDSAQRVDCFRNILSSVNLHMVGQPPRSEDERIEKVPLRDEFGSVNFYLLPFVRPSMVRDAAEPERTRSYDEVIRGLIAREDVDGNARNVIVSHQFYVPVGKKPEDVERMDSELARTVGNIDAVSAAALEPFDYAALGHIHKPMAVGDGRFRYCGTPLACSVSEAGQQKSVLLVNLGQKGTPAAITPLPLKPLREVRKIEGTLEEVLSQTCGDYVMALLTDTVDLNVADMQDRLRASFPYLLGIERKTTPRPGGEGCDLPDEGDIDPFELCRAYLGDLDDAQEKLLRDVINTVKEAN